MKINRVLTGITAAVMALVAGPALATGSSYNVNVGGMPLTAATTFTAATPTIGTNVQISALNNSSVVINLNCLSSTLSGTAQSGFDVLSSTSSTWSGCTAPGGAMTVTHAGTWAFYGVGTYTAAANETVGGAVEDIEMIWKNKVNPAICSFRIKGTSTTPGEADATFDESTQKLAFVQTGYAANLTLQNVTGCGGQVQNGNHVNLLATYDVAAVGGAMNFFS